MTRVYAKPRPDLHPAGAGRPTARPAARSSFFNPVLAFFNAVLPVRVMNSAGERLTARICNQKLPGEPAKDGWYHLAPFGEFPGVIIDTRTGKERKGFQVIDATAVQAMETAFRKAATEDGFRGLLLDYDHQSWKGMTAAAGRIKDMEIRGDGSKPEHGIWIRIDFTPPGEAAVRDGVYSWLSMSADGDRLAPASDGSPRMRPLVLTDAALTNLPRLPVMAMNGGTDSPGAVPGGQQEADEAKETSGMKEIALALGLAEDADMPAILAKIKSLSEAAAQLPQVQNAVKALEKAELRRKAEAFVETHKAHIKDSATVIDQYMAAPEATMKLFGSLATPKAEAPPRSYSGGRTPQEERGAKVQDRRKKQDEAVREHMRVHNVQDYGRAQRAVAQEKPDLFAEDEEHAESK